MGFGVQAEKLWGQAQRQKRCSGAVRWPNKGLSGVAGPPEWKTKTRERVEACMPHWDQGEPHPFALEEGCPEPPLIFSPTNSLQVSPTLHVPQPHCPPTLGKLCTTS